MITILYHFALNQDPKALVAWKTIASYFVQHKGALGSTLYKTHDGTYIAQSRWPSKALHQQVWVEKQDLPPDILQAISSLEAAIIHKWPEIYLDEIASL